MNALGPSWKPKAAGIATIVAGIANLIIDAVQHGAVSTEAAGIAVTAVMAGVGLMQAKQHDVSNSPIPLATPQVVALAPVLAAAPADALGAVVPVVNTPVVTAPAPEGHKF
jgi:hypothetical protein